ncbi:unnamed protein product [Tuber melanosporum]|uniref:(Perigord truffle) hypothetical protein n=1 Tax=Tuber melanosporum (strain Mel28) TaxID=656061 RepID=D5GA02_TUBMM|nr:uncharacterized protein GSTUM_00003475001 [Tuber melanosporum]CAZ81345.1 unnamed protein product [Tuber melanosporum]
MVESRSRLTREQIQLLERQFSDSPKPNTKIRRVLADKTGLSVQRVGNWFQNRRAKAKQQKRQEEMQTRQILASAGRRRATEPSSPVSSSPLLPTGATTTASSGTVFPVDSMMIAPKPPRRAKSFADIPSTPTRFAKKHGEGVSPYSSPSEASYASLARSLAVAAAAAAHADSVGGFQVNSHEIPNRSQPQSQLPGYMHPFTLGGAESPWPISRFSDYGSSTASSVIYTPTPAGQLEDPFEYDQISPDSDHHYEGGDSQSGNTPAEPAGYFDYHYPQEDFSAFAAAIDVTSTQRTFVLPAMPPTRFLRSPRAGDGQGSQPQPQPHRDNHYYNLDQQQQREEVSERDFIRRDSCPGEFLDAFSSIDLPEQAQNELPRTEDELTPEAEPSHQQSLANRRKAPTPTPLGTASLRNSFLPQPTAPPHSSTLPSSNLSLPATSMRRIKSTSSTITNTATLSRFSPPSSPPITAVQAKSFNGLLLDGLDWDMEEVDSTATIRPRTAGSGTTTGKAFSLATLFKVEAPPTPVSPADASAASSSSSSPPTTTNNEADAEMSPPATPANQQCTSTGNNTTGITPEANFETAQYRICTAPRSQSSSVPRMGREEFYNGDTGGMIGFVGFSGGGGEEFDAFATAEVGGGKEEEAFPFERYLAIARNGSGEGVF